MEMLIYNIKVAIILVALYPVYKLFLSRETFLSMNRLLLLLIVAVGFMLPHVSLSLSADSQIISANNLSVMLDEFVVNASAPAADDATSWTTVICHSLAWLYFLGILAFAGRLVFALVSLSRTLRKGTRQALNTGAVLVLVDDDKVAPFSWMRFIVMSRGDFNDNKDSILTHEMAHVTFGHSFDLLLLDLACTIQWFNPFMWLLRREMCAVHEYEADKAVLDSGVDAKQYQILLIKKAAGVRWSSIANSFNHSKLKYRISMMLRKKSSEWARAKALYALPVVALATLAFANVDAIACKDTAKDLENANVPVLNVTSDNEPDDVFMVCEVMPKYASGDEGLRKYIASSVRYPSVAAQNGIEGKLYVAFVITKDGSIHGCKISHGNFFKNGKPIEDYEGNIVMATTNDVKVVSQDVAELSREDVEAINALEAEAMRVVNEMPESWTPGSQRGHNVNVQMILPIHFSLGTEASNASVKAESDPNHVLVMGFR